MDGHRRSSGLTVVDGDGHVVEPPDLWQSRMDASRWGDWIPRVDPGDGTLYVGGEVRGGGPETLERVSALSGIPLAEVQAGFEQTAASLSRRGGFDPTARLEDMARDGLDAAVIYPTSGLFFAPLDPIAAVRNPEFALDCQRAYNDWLAEYCDAA